MTTTGVALFVAALALATIASGVWCVVDALRASTLRRAWTAIAILAAAAVAAYLRYRLLPPHHAMYLDEPWYAEAACSLARSGAATLCTATWSGVACKAYEKAMGWPVVLTLWALLAGCGTAIGIALNRIIGTATVLLVAAATRYAGGRWWQAALAAGILAVHPTHVAWSVTGETNVPAAAALLAGICGALRYVRDGSRAGAALAISGLGLAVAMRPESLLAALVAATIVALAATDAATQRQRTAAAIAVIALAAALSALPLWTMNTEISSGAFLSPASIPAAIAHVAGGDAARVHGLLVVLAVVGAFVLARQRRAAAVLLLAAGIGMSLVVLAYDRFDERMLLAATLILLPLAGSAVAVRRESVGALAAFGALALIAWWWSAPLRSLSVAETQLLETRLAAAAAAAPVPPEALVIAAQPTVLAANGTLPPMPLNEALSSAEHLSAAVASGRPVFFLCDMFCESGFAGGSGDGCRTMFASFSFAPVVEETVPGRTYGLYRVLPHDPAVPPPPCPRLR